MQIGTIFKGIAEHGLKFKAKLNIYVFMGIGKLL